MQVEVARLYQQANVNPLAGCLPTLVTIPVWIGLYRCALAHPQQGSPYPDHTLMFSLQHEYSGESTKFDMWSYRDSLHFKQIKISDLYSWRAPSIQSLTHLLDASCPDWVVDVPLSWVESKSS